MEKTTLKVSENMEIVVAGKDGFVITDTLQNKTVAVFTEEIEGLILAIQEAKSIISKLQ